MELVADRLVRPKRVFLSHASDMGKFPTGGSFVTAAEAAVRRANHVPREMKLFPVGPSSAEESAAEVRACEIYVGLIGFKYGTPVRDRRDVSYTELEYEAAGEARIPRLLFLLDEDADVPPRAVLDWDFGRRQAAFRERVEEMGKIVGRFRTAEELDLLVYQALLALPPRPLEEPGFSMAQEPVGYIPRRALGAQLFKALKDAKDSGSPAALWGDAGFGKTTLAQWICAQRDVKDWFPDAVLWVTLGANRSRDDILATLRDLCATLSGSPPPLADLRRTGEYLGELVGDRKVLMVLDAVWRRRDLEAFFKGAPDCTRLIVTRVKTALPQNTLAVPVKGMTDAEARDALCFALSRGDESFDELLAKAGNWPLLLRLFNGTLREVGKSGTLGDAVAWLEERLRSRLAEQLDMADARQADLAVAAAVDVALLALKENYEDVDQRCEQLAIFPEGAAIPVPVLETYWGLDAVSVRTTLTTLASLGLISRFDTVTGVVHIHTEVRRHLRNKLQGRLTGMNLDLLNAHLTRSQRPFRVWADLPRENRYLWMNLAHHLVAAGLGPELIATASDLRYLATKAFYFEPPAAEADLREALVVAPQDAKLLALHTSFRQAAHLLAGFDRVNDLAATLRSRLGGIDILADSVARLEATLSPPYFAAVWPVPDHPDPGLIRTFTGHWRAVNSAVFDARGERVVSASADGRVLIWDAQTGELAEDLVGHDSEVNWAVFDGGGGRVVSGGADGTVRLWDAEFGVEIKILGRHRGPVNSVAFDATGRFVASGGADRVVRICDVRGGRSAVELVGHQGTVNSVAFDPSGRRVVWGGEDGTVRVGGRAVGSQLLELVGHQGAVNTVLFDASGQWVLSGGDDRTVRTWDAVSGEQRELFVVADRSVQAVAVDGAGLRLLVGGPGSQVRVLEWDSGAEVATLVGNSDGINSVSFDPLGVRVVSAGADKTVRIWNAGVPRPAHPEPNRPGRVNSVAMDASGTRGVSAGADETVRVWDIASGVALHTLPGHWREVNTVAVHQGDGRIVSGGFDNTIRIWDLPSGDEPRVMQGHTDPVNCVTAVANEIFSCGGSHVRIWDQESGETVVVLAVNESIARSLAVDRAGNKIVTSGDDGIVRVVDRLAMEGLILKGHRKKVNSVAIDHTGSRVVSASDDGTVRVWDAHHGIPLAVLKGHVGPVCAAIFDKAGGRVISVGADGSIRLWDHGRGTEQAKIRVDGPALSCCGSDLKLLIGGEHGLYLLRVVDGDSGPGKRPVPVTEADPIRWLEPLVP